MLASSGPVGGFKVLVEQHEAHSTQRRIHEIKYEKALCILPTSVKPAGST